MICSSTLHAIVVCCAFLSIRVNESTMLVLLAVLLYTSSRYALGAKAVDMHLCPGGVHPLPEGSHVLSLNESLPSLLCKQPFFSGQTLR